MAAPSPTLSAPEELYAAPTDVAPPIWVFPPALNRSYVAEFNARLPPSSERRAREDGEVALLPPSPFSDNYGPADIALDSITNMTYYERKETPSEQVGKGFVQDNYHPIVAGDNIVLDWEGSDAKTVRMTCHFCDRWSYRTRILGRCLPDTTNQDPIDSKPYTFSGTISANGSFSQDKFQAPNPWDAAYNPVADEMPLPKIEPGTTLTLPSLPEESDSYVCMLTLNWDPWAFSSDHSIPFPVFGRKRHNDEHWKFTSEFPAGTPLHAAVSLTTSSMYTSPPRSSSTSYSLPERLQTKKTSTETAVGASFGGIIALVLVGAIFYACCKQSHKEKMKNKEAAAAIVSARRAGQAPQRTVLRPGFDTDGTIEVPPPSYTEVIRTTRSPPPAG